MTTNSPLFEPHLTVVAGDFPKDTKGDDLGNWCNGLGKVSLRLKGIEHGPEYFRCVFAAFERTNAYDALYQQVLSSSRFAAPYNLYPHLSIIYGDLPVEQRAPIASRLVPPWTEITFDKVSFVVADSGDWKPVEQWRVVKELTLG